MTRRVRSIILVAATTVAACAHRAAGGGEAEVRLAANPDVRWETEGPHEVTVVLENAGSARVAIPEPSAAHAQVVVTEAGAARVVCHEDAALAAADAQVIDLAPRERRALAVRLESCDPPPGEYRYELSYVVPQARGATWSGRVGPARGRILVQRSAAVVEQPASRRTVAPPRHPAPAGAAPASPHPPPAVPGLGPASLACVDRELARRGLNAYGDPVATLYPDGPPVLASEVERQRLLLERYPDVATLCLVPP